MDAFEEEIQKIARSKSLPSSKSLSEAVSRKSSVYTAFEPSPEPRRMLWIQVSSANKGVDTAPAFAYLQVIITDGNGQIISMNFGPFLAIRIFGRNLQSLFEKLLRHEVVSIHEFDPRKWKVPGEGEPCVTGIEMRFSADKSREVGTRQ